MDSPQLADPTRIHVDHARLEGDDLMGSAPARRSFESRLGSSARRGAYVGNGVPGVYRVTRSRTTQAQSLSRARVNPNAWIQPDDMVLQRNMTKVGSQSHAAYFDDEDVLLTHDPGTPYGFAPDNYPLGGKLANEGPFNWFCSVPFWNVGTLAADAVFEPDVGDWPPGATGVELENPEGVLVTGTCHVVGTARWSQSGTSDTWGITVRRYPRLGYDFSGSNPTLPGDSGYHEPETNPDLAALYNSGAVVGSLASLTPGGTTEDYDWPVDDPDAEGWVALFVLPDSSFGTVLAALGYADGSIHAVDLSNNGGTTPYIEATFTPPRYRFTF